MNTKMKRSTATWIWDFAGEYRSRYVLSVLSAVCGVICGILPYFVMANMIGDLLGGCRDTNIYLQHCLVMALLWVGRCGFHSISTTLSHKATFAVLGNIRKRVCEKLTRVPLGTVLDMPSGSMKNVLVERIDSIETTMAHIIPEFTSNLLVPIALLVYLFVLDWRMALAVLATVPIGFGCYAGMTRGYAESYQNTVDKTKILNDTAVEYINGIEVIKAFGKAQSSYEKFVVAAKEGASCYVEWMRRCNIYFCLAMSVFPATMVAVLPIGGLLFRAGTLDANTFIQVILFSVGLITSLITVMSYGDDLAKLSTIIGEVTGILEQEEQTRPQVSASQPKNNDIALHDVTFGYHEKEVLHGINMTIREGTVNALVGPSGSGKSTIAKLIAGLWDVDGGSISFGGVDIRQMTQQDYNRYIAYVSQDNYLFDTTVMENIRMGNQSATDEEVIEAAQNSGCHDFIMSLDHGYQTIVGGVNFTDLKWVMKAAEIGGGWQYPLQWYPPGAAGKGQPVRTDVAFSYCCAGYGGRRCSTMIKIFRRFFNFCGEINKRKFTKSIFLGVLKAMFEALKIPAIAVTLQGVLSGNLTVQHILLSFGIMLLSIAGNAFANYCRQTH